MTARCRCCHNELRDCCGEIDGRNEANGQAYGHFHGCTVSGAIRDATGDQVVFRVDDRTIHLGHLEPKLGGWWKPVCAEGCELTRAASFELIGREQLADADERALCPRLLERSIADRHGRELGDAVDAGITTQDIRSENA